MNNLDPEVAEAATWLRAGGIVLYPTDTFYGLAVDPSQAEAVASVKIDAAGLNSDLHASAEYRAHLIGVMTKRAVQAAG